MTPITLWNGSVLVQPVQIFPNQKFSKIVGGLGSTANTTEIKYMGDLHLLISFNAKISIVFYFCIVSKLSGKNNLYSN